MGKLRYINLGAIEPKYYSALWEYLRLSESKDSIWIFYTVSSPTFGMANLLPFSEQCINLATFPDGVSPRRLYTRIYTPSSLVFTSGVMMVLGLLPSVEPNEAQTLTMSSIVKVLRKHKIESYRVGVNDLYITVGSKQKKFWGHLLSKVKNSLVQGLMTFDCDIPLAREIYDITTDKFTKKGEVKDIGDIIGGLHEIAPDLNMNTVAIELGQVIATRLNLEFKTSNFSVGERDELERLASFLDNDEWNINARRKDIE